ncbi:hypothetical protein BP6252_13703 [Coleophoma cylindrospora]|uniref:Zn(2)-C6 fungal-type domain-containing protein n=1 Tax=Coleophoma cylindrospora TaxID=1849047 RepID=A0A3D8Q740_9HELO|nr:hypothetical protein BP6252_13703 [Coleophoma cylindrospora]
MVNTGRPSTGCHLCRARRIKCDEGKPSCLRCAKIKRECPGYRDSFELNLRDETKCTQTKAARKSVPDKVAGNHSLGQQGSFKSKSLMKPKPGEFMWTIYTTSPPSYYENKRATLSKDSRDSDSSFSLSQELSTPIDQQAVCYFQSTFVLVPVADKRGYYDFVVPLLQKEPPGSPLSVAFSAVCLGALGRRPNSRSLLPQADAIYGNALKQVNLRLQDPKLALKDSTLAAKIISTHTNAKGWMSHLEGACALAKSRGKKQAQTKIGRDLFIAVRSQMTLSAIAQSRSVGADIDWWVDMTENDKTSRVAIELSLRLADLRAATNNILSEQLRTSENLEKVLKHLREAELLDQRYIEWFDSLPPNWQPGIVAWIEQVSTKDLPISNYYAGRVYLFTDIWQASQYVLSLSSRLLIQVTTLRCLARLSSPFDYRITPEYAAAVRISQQLIADLTASLPYFFSSDDLTNMSHSTSGVASGRDGQSNPKLLSGLLCVWPIFVAAVSDFATESQRAWLRGRLRYIAEDIGLNHAGLLLKGTQLRYPSMLIKKDTMNLPPSDFLLSSATNLEFPASPASISESPPPLDVEEISRLYLSNRDSRMLHVNDASGVLPQEKYAEFIAV